MSEDELKRDVTAMARLCHAQQFSLLGGEPTLHPKIDRLINIVKESGISDLINITTHGMFLDKMSDDFWLMVNRMEIVVRGDKLSDSKIEFIKEKCHKYGVALTLFNHPQYIEIYRGNDWSEAETKRNFNSCSHRNCKYIQQGELYVCPGSSVIPSLMGLPVDYDGVDIDKLTEQTLEQFWNTTLPVISCSRCMVPCNISHPWRETTRASWLRESTH
jgi:MoaA/NifB/PqqE/SkfB family radical SAM enzyme